LQVLNKDRNMTRVSRDLRRFRTVLELLVKMGMGMLVS
jgi:hypothetical protein